MITQEQLGEAGAKFRGWSIQSREPDLLEAAAKEAGMAADIPALVQYFYDILGDIPFSMEVSKGNIPRITIARKPLKKYGRLYTSGCFDVFHFGHLNILERSKALCDFLVVGVSTDALIEQEKGKRPVIPYEERSRVIESIEYVDLVIPQVDKDKQKIVDTYGIDAISVGSDWKGRYPKVSCAMEYFPYTESISSTILKNTLQLTLSK